MLYLKNDIYKFYNEFKRQSNKERRGLATKPRNLNIEGAAVYKNVDHKALLGHISNYSAIISLLRQYALIDKSLKIIELGCGSGLFSVCFSKFLGKNAHLNASDYNENLIVYAKKAYAANRVEFNHFNALSLPLTLVKEAQVIFCCELWEHLVTEDQAALLKSLYNNLNKDALVLFTTPDLSVYKKGKSNYYAHKKEFTYKELKKWLEIKENNPFINFKVFRLINKILIKDIVFLADNFGYYLNTIYKSIYNFSLRSNLTKDGLNLLTSYYYKILGELKNQKVPEEYFGTYLVDSESPEYDKASFSLVVKLKR